MGGTTAGGKLTAQKNKKDDPDFYKRIGAKGGAAPHKTRGFGAMSRETHLAASAKGGSTSRRRGKWSVDEYLARAKYYGNRQEQLNREARGEV